MKRRFQTVNDINEFSRHYKILVLPGHEWSGEECDFVEMCEPDGKAADPSTKLKKGRVLFMKVKTQYGTEVLLESKYIMWIVKKVQQNRAMN